MNEIQRQEMLAFQLNMENKSKIFEVGFIWFGTKLYDSAKCTAIFLKNVLKHLKWSSYYIEKYKIIILKILKKSSN